MLSIADLKKILAENPPSYTINTFGQNYIAPNGSSYVVSLQPAGSIVFGSDNRGFWGKVPTDGIADGVGAYCAPGVAAGDESTKKRYRPQYAVAFSVDNVDNIRLFAGLAQNNTDVGNTSDAFNKTDQPTTEYVGVRALPGDTFFSFVGRGASNQTVDTGLAIVAGAVYVLSVNCMANGSVVCRLFNASAPGDTHEVELTGDLPALDTLLHGIATLGQSVTEAAKYLQIYSASLLHAPLLA